MVQMITLEDGNDWGFCKGGTDRTGQSWTSNIIHKAAF